MVFDSESIKEPRTQTELEAGMTILAHSAGSSFLGCFSVICSKTVTLSPFCRWPRTSPAKEACPRKLMLAPMIAAVTGGFNSTIVLAADGFLAGLAEASGLGAVFCAMTMTAVRGA